MARDWIGKRAMTAFREHFVRDYYLRTIADAFEDEGFEADSTYEPNVGGQRREYVEQFYVTIDRTDRAQVGRLLRVYEGVLLSCGDNAEHDKLVQMLERDGINYDKGRLRLRGGVRAADRLSVIAEGEDQSYLAAQLTVIHDNIETNPTLAIGTAKELVETTCHTLLRRLGEEPANKPDLQRLVKLVTTELKLTPNGVEDDKRGRDSIVKTLGAMSTVVQGLAELRNTYGTGHGKHGQFKGLQPRHARLAEGAASTVSTFLIETWAFHNREG